MRLELELADDHRVATAAEDGALALEAALEHSGACARLQGGEFASAEASGPIRHERRVRRTGHGVLVDPEIRHENGSRCRAGLLER